MRPKLKLPSAHSAAVRENLALSYIDIIGRKQRTSMAQWLDLTIHMVSTHVRLLKSSFVIINAIACFHRETRRQSPAGKFYRSLSLLYVRPHGVARTRLFAVRCASFFCLRAKRARTTLPVFLLSQLCIFCAVICLQAILSH